MDGTLITQETSRDEEVDGFVELCYDISKNRSKHEGVEEIPFCNMLFIPLIEEMTSKANNFFLH